MSDTPRTDAAERAAMDDAGNITRMEPVWDTMQELERENNLLRSLLQNRKQQYALLGVIQMYLKELLVTEHKGTKDRVTQGLLVLVSKALEEVEL